MTIERRLDASGAGTLTWCPQWWQHPEAIARLEALWRAWEVCRAADGEAPSRWFWQHCDPTLAVLMDAKTGPLSDCKPDEHRKYSNATARLICQKNRGLGDLHALPRPHPDQVRLEFSDHPEDVEQHTAAGRAPNRRCLSTALKQTPGVSRDIERSRCNHPGMHEEASSLMHPKVDPAALLVAVLAVGVSPLTTVGAWDKMNTVVAVVVGAVLVAFTWPRKQHYEGYVPKRDDWVTAALAAVYGFLIAIGVAWPVQEALRPPDCGHPRIFDVPNACTIRVDDLSNDASYWGLGIGGLAALGLFFWMREVIKRFVAASTPTP